jgi:hypothetical protein
VRNQWSGVASSTSFSIIQFKAIAGHQTRSFLEVAGHARAHSVSLALTRYSGHIGRKAGRHGRFATSSESERSVVIRPRPDFESDAFNRARPPLRESFQRYVGRFPLALYFPPAGLDGFPKFPSTSSMVGPPTSHRSSLTAAAKWSGARWAQRCTTPSVCHPPSSWTVRQSTLVTTRREVNVCAGERARVFR